MCQSYQGPLVCSSTCEYGAHPISQLPIHSVGGVVGYAQTTVPGGPDSPPVVGFDMGGTSTDVSRTHNEDYQYIQETQLDGITLLNREL